MSDKIGLTKKQILFLTEMLEIEDPSKAVDRFIELLAEQGVDPMYISEIIDKILI